MKMFIALLAGLCLVLVYFICSQFPQPTYKLRSDPKILTPEVKVGEMVKWQNDICKLHDHNFTSQRTFINLDTGRRYPVPDIGTKGTLKKGECRVIESSQKVIESILPGRYELLIEVFVQSNHWSRDKFEYTVKEFTIK